MRYPSRLLRVGGVLEVDGPPIGVEHGLVHRLRQGRVRENRADQLGLGRFQGLGDGIALDQLGDLGADLCAPNSSPVLPSNTV